MFVDEWNVFCFYDFKGFKNYGVKIWIFGFFEFGDEKFMYCKFCVIDSEVIIEGLNNWMVNV